MNFARQREKYGHYVVGSKYQYMKIKITVIWFFFFLKSNCCWCVVEKLTKVYTKGNKKLHSIPYNVFLYSVYVKTMWHVFERGGAVSVWLGTILRHR